MTTRPLTVQLTYDDEVDVAYLALSRPSDRREPATTYTCDPDEVQGRIDLHFDADGHLIGVEVLEADKKLPRRLLERPPG